MKINIENIEIEYDNNCVRIVDSYKIQDLQQMTIILTLFKIKTNFESKRSLNSWIKEWKAHNRLYKLGLFLNHTKDCDLEENEKWWRLLAYQILGI